MRLAARRREKYGPAELFVKHVQQQCRRSRCACSCARTPVHAGGACAAARWSSTSRRRPPGGRVAEPVTVDTDLANEQHYGNDPHFFRAHLGPRLKYSACEWPAARGAACALGEAEDYTIALYQEKAGLAGLAPGARVLELGCGWGSLSLANAAKFPKLQFVSFSNSPQQIGFIREQCKERGITNLAVHVEDYAVFCTDQSVLPSGARATCSTRRSDRDDRARARIRTLLDATSKRLKPGAKFFVHSLLHQSASYLTTAATGWAATSSRAARSSRHHFHLPPTGCASTR